MKNGRFISSSFGFCQVKLTWTFANTAIATTSALVVSILSGLPGRSRTTPTRTRVRLFPRWRAISVVGSGETSGLGSILRMGLVTFSPP